MQKIHLTNKMTKLLMIRISFFIALLPLILNPSYSFSQERILPLNTNEVLIQKNKEKASSVRNLPSNLYWIFSPITSLPFQDDFSRIKAPNFNPDEYPTSAKSDTLWHSVRINGMLPVITDLYFMKDTSFSFSYNSSTQTVTKLPNPALTVTFYQNKMVPNQVTMTKILWPVSDSINFNQVTQQPDTFFIQPDTLVSYVYDTLHYIKIPAGPYKWKNNNVFWNDTYPVNPPSIGVVTFDGIDSTGYPYNFNLTTAYGKADVLNSVPIDMSLYNPQNDSIYFSFFYQSTGRGNSPEPEDSLTLEFKALDGSWKRVWGKSGYTLNNDSVFSRKVFPLNDSIFFHKNFEFRFTNYATLSGSLDHWHIDYVRIDLASDTIIKDIAWVYPGKSLFNRYQQIPRKQYNGYNADFLKNYIRNLFTQPINVTYALRVKDYFNNTLFNIDVNNVDFSPQQINNCSFCNEILNPLVGGSFSFPVNTSLCARYEVGSLIQNIASEPNLSNDTMYYTQIFGDCFAYDDGTAEAAYGINVPYARMASKFNALVSDTLRALRIYFNPVIVNAAELNQFTIVVWAEGSDGAPGNELYRKTTEDVPQYGTMINGFVDYYLDATLIVSGNFFIGIEQLGASELNIGLDRNTNAMEWQYYDYNGVWYPTQFKGSWMMRPVFGTCQDFVSAVSENNTSVNFSLSPNPTNGLLYFNTTATDKFEINMYDLRGVSVLQQTVQNKQVIDLGHLANGLYFTIVSNLKTKESSTRKIIIFQP